jgi:hypothetical protein
MKIYYAHCMSLYGTRQEDRDIALLKSLGFTVVNPSDPKHRAASDGEMAYYKNLVKGCDALAFRGLSDSMITAGVAGEIQTARDSNKPIIELPSSVLQRYLTVEQTVEYLMESGQR